MKVLASLTSESGILGNETFYWDVLNAAVPKDMYFWFIGLERFLYGTI